MKKIIIILLFIVMVMSLGCHKQQPKLYDTNGNQIALTNLQGKWVVINYWAIWCKPCIKEVPELNKFAATNKNVVVLGVPFGTPPLDVIKADMKYLQIEFPVLQKDPAKIWDLSAVNVLPTTFIISPEGKVMKTIYGPNTLDSLTGTLKSLA